MSNPHVNEHKEKRVGLHGEVGMLPTISSTGPLTRTKSTKRTKTSMTETEGVVYLRCRSSITGADTHPGPYTSSGSSSAISSGARCSAGGSLAARSSKTPLQPTEVQVVQALIQAQGSYAFVKETGKPPMLAWITSANNYAVDLRPFGTQQKKRLKYTQIELVGMIPGVPAPPEVP